MFLTPSHQHPTNVTLSVERRTEILRQAREQDFIVVEDDYDSELRYRGSPSAAIASIDDGSRTFYVGTFSKFLAPGLRLGFVVAPSAVAEVIRQRRRYRHRQLPGHTQRALAILLQSGDYQRYLRKVRSTLARRWDIGQAAVSKYFPENQALPPGGTSLWIAGSETLDARYLSSLAQRQGILIDDGAPYFIGPAYHANYLRIGLGAIDESKIDEGLRRLSALAPRAT